MTPGATSDHKPNINAEFSEDLGGKALARTIAHEGTHLEDDLGFLNSYDVTMGAYSGGMNFTHFETEFSAFVVGSMVKPYAMFPAWPNESPKLGEYIYRAYPDANELVFPPSIFPQEDPPHQ